MPRLGCGLGNGPVLFSLIERLGTDNAKGEYYLTDLFALANAGGHRTGGGEADPAEVLGINSRAELAGAEAILQNRLRAEAMAGGATLIELVTYRAAAHSSSDDPKQYRPDDEGRLWPGGDPVARLADHMTRIGIWSAGAQQALEETVRQQVAAAFKEAERFGSFPEGPFHPAECLLEDVYQKAPWHIEQQRRQLRSA